MALEGNIDRCDPNDPVVIPEVKWTDDETYFAKSPAWSRCMAYGSDNYVKPHVRCKCGVWTGIGLHHVHADGRVTASFFDAVDTEFSHGGKTYHKDPGCGWHVFIKLEGYDCGEFPPEP